MPKMLWIWVYAVLLSSFVWSNSCPRRCQCLWRDSKITVDCSDRSMTAVPSSVEKNTQVLNMSGNTIPQLGRGHFLRLGLINLQRVSCSRCALGGLDPKAFEGLTNLVELDLSSNKLSEVPSASLNSEASALMNLNLASNDINVIRTRDFYRLKYLTKLDLSECKIGRVEIGAFEGLDSIQRIYLHGNQLVALNGRDLPGSLHGLSLHDNPWSCDCQLRSLRLWLTQSNVPRPLEPRCQSPSRLKASPIHSLSLAEFACAPQLSPTSMFLTVPRGKNVSIVCRISSDPISEISWYFNGKPIIIQTEAADSAEMSVSSFPVASERLLEGSNIHSIPTATNLGRIHVLRQDYLAMGGGSAGETRSELIIQQTHPEDNGTYYCQAENKAARTVSNFTLHVTEREPGLEGAPTVLQLKLEYFIAAAIVIIVVLVLVLAIVAILLIRICRSRSAAADEEPARGGYSYNFKKNPASTKLGSMMSLGQNGTMSNGKVVPVANGKMPRHIQMGTGLVANTKTMTKVSMPPEVPQPDLLTDHSNSSGLSSALGKASIQTGSTSLASSTDISQVSSFKLAIDGILDDYKQMSVQKGPLIGSGECHSLTETARPTARISQDGRQNLSLIYLDPCRLAHYPHDFGLPKTSSSSFMMPPRYLPAQLMLPDEKYPEERGAVQVMPPSYVTNYFASKSLILTPTRPDSNPIYESINDDSGLMSGTSFTENLSEPVYSRVNKKATKITSIPEEDTTCSEETTAIDRLSHLLSGQAATSKLSISQELDDAFISLDHELALS